jgi:hypothetical protein
MSDQWNGQTGKWEGGAKAYWQGDTASADFVIFVGASPFAGNYGPTNRVPRITQRYASGELKFAVIDPRLSKIAGKAWRLIPRLFAGRLTPQGQGDMLRTWIFQFSISATTNWARSGYASTFTHKVCTVLSVARV